MLNIESFAEKTNISLIVFALVISGVFFTRDCLGSPDSSDGEEDVRVSHHKLVSERVQEVCRVQNLNFSRNFSDEAVSEEGDESNLKDTIHLGRVKPE